jgi:di/tricarboxylate transporter
MLIPAVKDLSRNSKIPASKLMIPLSYAAILGGVCTLIGTSTNLVVQGLIEKQLLIDKQHVDNLAKMGMFDISWVGIPAAIVGGCYLIFAAVYLLPDRKAAVSTQDDPREYTVEMQVEANGPLIGKSIEDAGLRHLPGLYLAEIDREGSSIPAVSPQEVLRGKDRLLFVGAVESVVELHRIRGLVPATEDVFHLQAPRPQRCLIEAVVSNTNPFLGMTIRDSRFRNHYNAVVVAVARNGQRLHQKIGDIVLRAGDVLLVEAHPSFADQQRSSRDFFLVSAVRDSNPRRHELAFFALGVLAVMVVAASIGFSMLLCAAAAAAVMLLTRCVSVDAARRSIGWDVLLAIAAAFALGTALEKTGAASIIAGLADKLAGGNPWITLTVIYFTTVLITELITNNAAAALMFPFAIAAARGLNVEPMPFVIAVAMAASSSFATPIGYQTNLMVYGPGGYRFTDYLKIGVPLDLLLGVCTCVLTPIFFPFHKS